MSIADDQSRFYGDLYRRYGDDPRTLSSRDRATQYERFHRIARVFEGERSEPFTVHEIGCGLGHFGEYLGERFPAAAYSGSEVHGPFVELCRARFPQGQFLVRDLAEAPGAERYDYLVLSGVFNIPLKAGKLAWRRFVFSMLEHMYAMCRRGIAASFLTTYHDTEHARPDLHYQDEKQLLDHAVRSMSRHLELDMSGPLYEYTLRVYRPEHVRQRYGSGEFERYFDGRS